MDIRKGIFVALNNLLVYTNVWGLDCNKTMQIFFNLYDSMSAST